MPTLPPLRRSYRLTPLGHDVVTLLAATVVGLAVAGVLYGWWVL